MRLFIEAIAQLCDSLNFLYFVPHHMLSRKLESQLPSREVWGTPGESIFVPIAARTETFRNHYLAGLVTASGLQSFFPFSGSHQVETLRAVLQPEVDIVFASELQSMLPLLAAEPSAPVLFDLNDLVHRVHWRTATSGRLHPGKIGYALQVPSIIAAERRAIRAAALTTVCSDADRNVAARLGSRSTVAVIPNAVPVPVTVAPLTREPTLLFLGNYTYHPNAQAAERLTRRIWPMVHRARPDARLLLAGGSTERLPTDVVAAPGVECLGFVTDLDQLYSRSRVVCCPLSVGGGTRLKLIEGAAYGRPMVSTSIGAEGLDVQDGRDILLRDDDTAFANACLDLLTNDSLAERLGRSARILAARYDANNVRHLIVEEVRSILYDPARRQRPPEAEELALCK